MDHPFIVKFKEVFEDRSHYYLVLEYLEGGDLMKHLQNKKVLDEDTAKELLWQILIATNYLHS